MKLQRQNNYLLTRKIDLDKIFTALHKLFEIGEQDTYSGEEHYFDTFDWRLYRHAMAFYATKNELKLCQLSGSVIYSLKGCGASQYFWWDVEPSSFADKLKKCIEMRALLPIVKMNYSVQTIRVMNRDRKTIVRIAVRKETAENRQFRKELPGVFTIHEIRGYEKQFKKVVKTCEKFGLELDEKNTSPLDRGFEISNRKPLDYGAKFSVDLDDRISIGKAVATICRSLVESMEVNYPGVCSDLDSEFLHDFRISIRRTRSLLTLLKGVLPKERTAWFQSEFKWLGSITGPLRDIDVYLLEKQAYLGLVPGSLRDGLDVFFEDLERRRITELGLLINHLTSERYQKLVDTWSSFLNDTGSELFKGVRANQCRPVVTAIIKKRFKTFLRDADRIDQDSPPVMLHQLRIKGKKFRYLLEFFRSFYHVDDVDLFLKHMKKLQDNLGDYNDLSVQQEMLGTTLNQLKSRSRQTMRLAAALGGAISALADKQVDVRSHFKKTYGAFRKQKNIRLLTAMVSVDNNSRSTRGKR
jgi:CHAD domain-containing protein